MFMHMGVDQSTHHGNNAYIKQQENILNKSKQNTCNYNNKLLSVRRNINKTYNL